jgi:hypothetical protein
MGSKQHLLAKQKLQSRSILLMETLHQLMP